RIGRIVEIWQQGIASGKRLDDIFSAETESDYYQIEAGEEQLDAYADHSAVDNEMDKSKDVITGTIEFKDLSFTYPGTVKSVLNGINLKLEAGQTLGILGKTGSGKTTLVNLLLKLYDVDYGHIFIDGIDINQIPSDI